MKKKSANEKIIYFEYLRIISAFAVVLLHISAQNWSNVDVNSFEWMILNIYDSLVRWCVPIFVMISGAIFLNKKITIKEIFYKYIPKIFIVYIVTSTIYALVKGGTAKTIVYSIIAGHYHLWYLCMLIGLYASMPILKKIVEDKKTMKYFLILSLVMLAIIPYILLLVNDFGIYKMRVIGKAITRFIERANFKLVMGYSGYFILGHYINKIEIPKNKRTLIYILGITGFITITILTYLTSSKSNQPVAKYYDYFSLNVLAESLAVFVWCKYSCFKIKIPSKIIFNISKYCFAIYLIHPMIMDLLQKSFSIDSLSFNPILQVPILSLLVFIISFLIAFLLKKLPKVKNIYKSKSKIILR